MTKNKKSVQNGEAKAQERKFFIIAFLVTAIILAMLFIVVRNAI